jgi:uncharacterized protein
VKNSVFCLAFIAAFVSNALPAAEVVPPKPAAYFNDYAGVVSKEAASRFNEQLAQFERETSNQVVVAIFPKMQSDDDVSAYTQRVAQSWGVGQKDKRNGVVLFVFTEDHKMFIQVGYGLEGSLPDVAAFNITEYQIKPHFIKGDYETGLRVGIGSILNAIRGEYSGTHQIVDERERPHHVIGPFFFVAFFLVLSLIIGLHRKSRGYGISSKGSGWTIDWGNVIFFWISLLLSGRGGGSSGGSSSSSGGFSGGGGSFGGGGAGSSW